MRSIEDTQFRYIYNPWADGEYVFRNESQAGRTMKAMSAAAKNNAQIAARVKLFGEAAEAVRLVEVAVLMMQEFSGRVIDVEQDSMIFLPWFFRIKTGGVTRIES